MKAVQHNTENSSARKKVLFVDDEEHVLNALQRVFLQEGYDVVFASGGEEALTLLEKQPVHLVVTDQKMPKMSGTELLKEVQERYPQTGRMMLTGYEDPIVEEEAAKEEGCIEHLFHKPWIDNDLLSSIGEFLKNLTVRKTEASKDNHHIEDINQYRDWRKNTRANPATAQSNFNIVSKKNNTKNIHRSDDVFKVLRQYNEESARTTTPAWKRRLMTFDIFCYAAALVLGASVVLVNYYQPVPANDVTLDQKLEQIISRMDDMRSFGGAWASMDVPHSPY